MESMNEQLPPSVPISIKKEVRKDSYSWANDELMSMMSHTPPSFSNSMEMPNVKRSRSGSVSGRLRSASDLEERGVIDRYQKGVLKDLIIAGDASLQEALVKFEDGDPSLLEKLMDSGALNKKSSSLDLLDDLDFGFLNVGSLSKSPKDTEFPCGGDNLEEWDDIKFDSSFGDISTKYALSGGNGMLDTGMGGGMNNSLPSMGMGLTPPFGLSHDDFLKEEGEELKNSSSKKKNKGKKCSKPIGIPKNNMEEQHMMKISSNKTLVGIYSPNARRRRIEKFLEKRQRRVWSKKVKYDVRKNFADSRLRVKGRFVKKEDEQLLRELLSLT